MQILGKEKISSLSNQEISQEIHKKLEKQAFVVPILLSFFLFFFFFFFFVKPFFFFFFFL